MVGLLTAAGFASVYIARSDVVSAGSLSYAAFFISLFVIAHLILRVRLPHADPYLLPLGGLLSALGLTMIYRIDPQLAFRQGLWVVVGVAVFAGLGAQTGISAELGMWGVVFAGAVSGVGGGVLRDLLTGQVPGILYRSGDLYATAAAFGSAPRSRRTRTWSNGC